MSIADSFKVKFFADGIISVKPGDEKNASSKICYRVYN